MKLLKLTIHNFKGIENRELEPNGEPINIFGANALKKTTHFDAYSWLLTDKDSKDRSTQVFGIKPREVLPDGTLGEVIYGAEPEVEGVFELENGETLKLKKQHAEKWGTVRGSHDEQLTGYTTNHWINDEPIEKATDFNDRLQQIVSDDRMKILTNPLYVAAIMSKSERRALLLQLIEVSDEDIVEANPELEGYLELLDGREQSTVENILSERKKIINKQLGTKRNPGELPARIDENQQKIIELEQSREDAQESIHNLKAKKETIEAKRSQVKSGGVVAELNVKRQELQAEFKEQQNKHNQQVEQNLAGQREKVSELQDKVDEIESDFRDAKRDYEKAKSHVGQLESVKKNVESEIQQIKAREPEPANAFEPEKCALCERASGVHYIKEVLNDFYEFVMDEGTGTIREDDINSFLDSQGSDSEEPDYEEYLDEFNAQKAEELKKAKAELEKVAEDLDEALEAKQVSEKNAANIKGRLNQRKEALRKAQKELSEQKANQPDYASEEIEQQIEDIDRKIADHRTEKQDQLDKLDEHIRELDRKIEEHKKVIRQHENNAQYKDRIKELRAEKKELGAELIEVEHGLNLIEDFRRAHAIYITEKVNKKFNLVNWRMFRDQMNGGLEERCDPVYNSQPWDDLSTSEKVQCGLDIINTLSKHFGKSLPVWIDNRESCTNIPETDLQVISLIVSPKHKTLTVEKAQSAQPVTA